MQPDTSTTYLKQGQHFQREGLLSEAEVAYRLAMILADDDYVTEGFVDLVIWSFDTHPTVGGVFNCLQEHTKKSMFSTNPRGGCLYQKGLEGKDVAGWVGALCGSAFRQSFVDYHAFKLDASIIPQQWFSLDLVMRHDVYGLFS
ncbi:hypothetical protein, partial [Planktothrix sp.]|uniref:hypothetical protein n=1 Tax=Planktothrix sp. TaxID=3088171 RepID=UPI0038D3CF3B